MPKFPPASASRLWTLCESSSLRLSSCFGVRAVAEVGRARRAWGKTGSHIEECNVRRAKGSEPGKKGQPQSEPVEECRAQGNRAHLFATVRSLIGGVYQPPSRFTCWALVLERDQFGGGSGNLVKPGIVPKKVPHWIKLEIAVNEAKRASSNLTQDLEGRIALT